MRCLVLVSLAACTSPLGSTSSALTDDARHERLGAIRDIAAQMGMHNAALLGGIAVSETGLAHCWSEATWACQGPASSSCSDGPVIAGAADGPCADMQGGLGMFQFDAGTYAQTLASYGNDVLTVEGNTALAVNFVVDKVEQDIAGATDWLASMAWMNAVPLVAGDPVTEQWAKLLACRYNGCCSTSSTCTTRANGYRDNAIAVFSEMGADFWNTAGRCSALPADGVIAVRGDCYLAAGDPRFWRHEAGGLEWTLATTHAAPANFAEWIVKAGGPARYRVEVSLDGGTFGQSHQAAYQIAHGGTTDTVVIDQAAGSGFVELGEFDFTGDGDEHVLLGDDTGEGSDTKILFDAIRVTNLDGTPPGGNPGDGGGGCTTTGGALGGGALVAMAMLLVRRRRR